MYMLCQLLTHFMIISVCYLCICFVSSSHILWLFLFAIYVYALSAPHTFCNYFCLLYMYMLCQLLTHFMIISVCYICIMLCQLLTHFVIISVCYICICFVSSSHILWLFLFAIYVYALSAPHTFCNYFWLLFMYMLCQLLTHFVIISVCYICICFVKFSHIF